MFAFYLRCCLCYKMQSGLQEMFEMELRKQTDEASSKVAVVLQRAEEQGQMIEALHRSVSETVI